MRVGSAGDSKSAQSAAFIPRLGPLRIRSDVERKRLAGLSAEAKTASTVAAGIYDAAMTARTYERLLGSCPARLAAAGTAARLSSSP